MLKIKTVCFCKRSKGVKRNTRLRLWSLLWWVKNGEGDHEKIVSPLDFSSKKRYTIQELLSFMSQDFEKLLLAAGLLPSEVKVYLSALEMGPSSVQNIAAKAGISRTATYEAVEMLQKRGLMASSTVGKKSVFSAEDPERIVAYLQSEQQRFTTTIEDVTRSLDAMRLIAGGIRPTVRVFEGEEALRAYFDHIAQTKPEEFSEISNLDDVYKFLETNTIQSARRAYTWAKMKRNRLLHVGPLRNPREGVEFAELEKKWGDFHGNIAIYGKYVAFVTYVGKLVVVIMESETLANSMQVLFNIAWETSKKTSARS